MRWLHRYPGRTGPALDYGLLFAAATVATEDSARMVCRLLRRNGIRATSGPTDSPTTWGGTIHILVFPEDAPYAYAVLCQNTV